MAQPPYKKLAHTPTIIMSHMTAELQTAALNFIINLINVYNVLCQTAERHLTHPYLTEASHPITQHIYKNQNLKVECVSII